MPPRREPPEPTAIEMICQFNKLKPPKFESGSNLGLGRVASENGELL